MEGRSLTQITLADINKYLEEVHKSVREGNYRIDTNSKRQDNRELYTKYIIDEELSKRILLSLKPEDFSEIVNNEHAGYEYERLYIFGKEVKLLERFGEAEKKVSLYIKFNKLEKDDLSAEEKKC